MRWTAIALAGLMTLLLLAGALMPTSAQTRTRRLGSGIDARTSIRAAHVSERRPRVTLASLRQRRPVAGVVTSDFGIRRSFWGRRFHTGIDVSARRGTPVRASGPGTVAFTGWRRGYGRTIVVDHGHGLQTVYAHLSRFKVRPGAAVRSGTALGLVGTTGNTTGPHLHYEVLRWGRPVDPQAGPARTSFPSRERMSTKKVPGSRGLANLPSAR